MIKLSLAPIEHGSTPTHGTPALDARHPPHLLHPFPTLWQ